MPEFVAALEAHAEELVVLIHVVLGNERWLVVLGSDCRSAVAALRMPAGRERKAADAGD